jgi:hypothetical protein
MDVLGIAYDEFTNAQREGKAESVYFKSKAGAKVFSTGSIRWVWGLSKTKFEREQFKAFRSSIESPGRLQEGIWLRADPVRPAAPWC